MNINFQPKKCSGQSRYGRYGSYATGPTANLVIVFETFKRSHNLKTWLRFVPRRGKIFLASYCMYSFSCCSVELRDTNTNCVIGSLAICFGIRLCRSVRSYVCAELLSTREGSPSKGGCICTPLTPPWIRHCVFSIQIISHWKALKQSRTIYLAEHTRSVYRKDDIQLYVSAV